MRRIRYSVAGSLDGYIAGPGGEADWIPSDPDFDFGALWAEFDTLLIGRRTFESMVKAGRSEIPGMKIVVFSRAWKPGDHPGVTIVSEDVAQSVETLRAAPGKDIWLFGGGRLFHSLLAMHLVDTVEVAVVPVLLGGGVPLLPTPSDRANLALTKHEVYPKTGIVRLTYTVKRSPVKST
jgi:dihydrofolate reductase